MVYELDPSDGRLIQAHRFDFTVQASEIPERTKQFMKNLDGLYFGVCSLVLHLLSNDRFNLFGKFTKPSLFRLPLQAHLELDSHELTYM